MASLEVTDLPLTGRKARRLGDMAGMYFDLQWTVAACAHLLERPSTVEPEMCVDALHDTALIRYARCYKTGRRNEFHIPPDWLENLDARLNAAHHEALTLRDKHIAHSINDWEINVPTAEVARAGPAATVRTIAIRQLRASLGRTAIQNLHDLAKTLVDRVHAEMVQLRKEVFRETQCIPPKELKRRAPKIFPQPARRKVGKDRSGK